MPRKKIVTTEEVEDPIVIPQEPPDLPPTQDEMEYASFEEGIAPGFTRLKIYRLADGEQLYCYSCESGSFTEESLRRKYPGGGKFIIRFIDSHNHFHGSKIINIDAAPMDANAPVVAAPPPASNLEINLLREQVNRQHEMILKFMERPNGAAAPSMTEILGAVRDMQALSRAPDLTTVIGPVIDLFTKTMEAARESGGDNSMSWLKLASGALEKLPQIVNQISAQKAQAAQGAPAGPEQQAALLLQRGLAYLKDKALKNKDVTLYVDLLSDNLDDPNYRPVAGLLLNMPFEEIGKYDPEILQEPLRAWFFRLYNELRKLMYENQEPATGADGSIADTSGNETVDA
jgi:hypothetical protein